MVARQVMSSASFQSTDRNGLCKQRLIEYFAYKQPCSQKTQVPNYCCYLFQNVCLHEKTMQTRSRCLCNCIPDSWVVLSGCWRQLVIRGRAWFIPLHSTSFHFIPHCATSIGFVHYQQLCYSFVQSVKCIILISALYRPEQAVLNGSQWCFVHCSLLDSHLKHYIITNGRCT